jgi:hypothetical protein
MKKTTLKQELKKSFPNVKFSVRKRNGTFSTCLVVKFKQTVEATYDSVMGIAFKFERQEYCDHRDIWELKNNRREDLEQADMVVLDCWK